MTRRERLRVICYAKFLRALDGDELGLDDTLDSMACGHIVEMAGGHVFHLCGDETDNPAWLSKSGGRAYPDPEPKPDPHAAAALAELYPNYEATIPR